MKKQITNVEMKIITKLGHMYKIIKPDRENKTHKYEVFDAYEGILIGKSDTIGGCLTILGSEYDF